MEGCKRGLGTRRVCPAQDDAKTVSERADLQDGHLVTLSHSARPDPDSDQAGTHHIHGLPQTHVGGHIMQMNT